MASIQLKRAFKYEGSASEAIDKISKLSGNDALKAGEPMAVRYLESSTNKYRYLTVICIEPATVKAAATLTVLPSFDNLDDYSNYIKSIVGTSGGGSVVSASDLQYIFSDSILDISGSNQAEFNGQVIDLIKVLQSRLTWQYL